MPREDHTSSDRSFDDLARAVAEGSLSRRRALKLFAGTAIAALIPSRALAQQQKVTICHKPGTPDEQTKAVSQSAVDRHLRHGDRLGPCESPTTSTTETPTTSTTETPTTTTTETPTTSTTETPTTTTTETPTTTTTETPTTTTTETPTTTTTETPTTTTTETPTTTTTPMCIPNGGTCSTGGTPCCSGNCSNGTCACPAGRVLLVNGTCALRCSSNAECPACGSTQFCGQGIEGPAYCTNDAVFEGLACSADIDCRAGQYCNSSGFCGFVC
jgi:hypothetical protein